MVTLELTPVQARALLRMAEANDQQSRKIGGIRLRSEILVKLYAAVDELADGQEDDDESVEGS